MRRRRAGKAADAPPAGSPAWMTTYGDLVTQMLAFFVLLYSFSSLNEVKFRETLSALQGAFGSLPDPTATSSNPAPPGEHREPPSSLKDASLLAVQKVMAGALKEKQAAEIVRFEAKDKALIIHFDASALFDSGRAELKQSAIPALDAVGAVLQKIPNQIRIEGHTDSDPMIPNLQYPDNWMLSGARATGVLRFLNEFHQIPHDRMSIAGYADTRPVAGNGTPEGKARNRRVDIVVLGR